MTSTRKPTVLFVHGSWHQPSHFGPVRKAFEVAGYPTSCLLQPSVGNLPPVGLKEDAQCIRDELVRLVNQESKDVIVVGHSYGGVVTTQAVDEGFSKKSRQAEGKDGGVLGLLYMAAFFLPINVSLAGAFGGSLPPFIKVEDNGMCMMDDPAHKFYHDLPKDEQEHWVSELVPCPAVAQETPLTQAAYLYHPVTYLFCENDQALPLAVQQMMVKGVSDATGIHIHTESCTGSHSPFLSMPERVVETVQKMVGVQA